MFQSHFKSGTGEIFVSSRNELRVARVLMEEIPEAEVAITVAPMGALYSLRKSEDSGMPARAKDPIFPEDGKSTLRRSLEWAAKKSGRIVIVLDEHVLINAPLHWRTLIEMRPGLRCPQAQSKGDSTDSASLAVFIGPEWELNIQNPLRDDIPIVHFAPPTRDELRLTLTALSPLPKGDDGERVLDAVCGLESDVAEQAAAETLAACSKWDSNYLRGARREALRSGGLEVWPTTSELGGLLPFQEFVDAELIPWYRDPQLAVRRLLMAGLPGTGKSWIARWLAHRLQCECVRLSIPRLKAGIVGQSEGNLRRCLQAADAMSKDAPIVMVIDEVDCIAREGLDGGTSSGMFAELLTWLQESPSQAVVIATLNRLDKLDASLESRFGSRWFFDLPNAEERKAIAEIWLRTYNCANVGKAAESIADVTEGFSSREIAQSLVPTVARLSSRKPNSDIIAAAAKDITPTAKSQEEQLKTMRNAAQALRRANTPVKGSDRMGGSRNIKRA